MMSDAKGPVKACVDVLCFRDSTRSRDPGKLYDSKIFELSHWYFKILILVERCHKYNSC